QAVAVEAGGNPLVRDHVRRRPALRPGLLLEGRQAEDVIDVPVREDRGVKRAARPAADRRVELACERGAARVHQDQPRAGLEGGDVLEGRHEGDPRIQLLELVERGPGVAVGGREVPAPEALRNVADLAHAALCSAEYGRDARGLTPGRGPRYFPARMRSVWITRTGPPEVLEVRDGPDPVPGPGQALVRVRATGVNFADVMARLGLYPDAPPRPCVVGYEVAGTVERLGPGADGVLAAGQRVIALTRFGGYAEAVAVPVAQLFPMPARMSFEEGAAIPVNYLTAVLMLRHFGNVKRGERVLVHAAAGGVGMAAIQLCKIAGAEVIGTASAAKHAQLRDEMLSLLADYEAGRIQPVVGKTFPLAEAAAAHRFIQERKNVGKVILTC